MILILALLSTHDPIFPHRWAVVVPLRAFLPERNRSLRDQSTLTGGLPFFLLLLLLTEETLFSLMMCNGYTAKTKEDVADTKDERKQVRK